MENITNCFIKTSALERTYKLEWTVEYVSKLPLGEEIKSPNFHFGGYIWHVSFTKYNSCVQLKLNREYSYIALEIYSEVKVLDCNGKVYCESTAQTYYNGKGKNVSLNFSSIESTILNELKLAPNDTWHFIFIIKTNQIVGKSSSETPSQQLCEEKTKNTFCANFWNMLENKIATDVTLQMQNGKIEAHKLVLTAQSPVFAKMFEIPMSESEKNTVVINDVSNAAMTLLINFMYSKIEIGYSLETALELYYAADKYEVFELRELCGKILISLLTDDNAVVILEMADKHKDGNLKSEVMEFINSNIKFCIKKDWWHELNDKKTELFRELMNFIK